MNFYKVFLYFDCFCISVFFITGGLLGDALIVTALSIIFQPIVFILAKYAIEYRKSKIKETEFYLASDLKIFELSARDRLATDKNPSVIIKRMYQNYFIQKNKLVFVYQAHYCAEILNNTHLALVKASQTNYKGLSIFTNFQIYKCQKHLEEKNLKTSSGLKLCLYLQDFNNLLKVDKNLCNFFLKFIDQVLSTHISTSNLFKSVKMSAELIQKIRKKYEDCLRKYPNSQIINEMYGSLLSKVLFDQEKGENYLLRSVTCAKTHSVVKEINIYLKKSLCYMILSGNSGETGKVLSASNNLAALLGIQFDGERPNYLADFIPDPYSDGHDTNLTRFIYQSLKTEILIDIPLFLINTEGFLVECFAKIECIGFESSIKFVVILDFTKNFEREAVIIDENWQIYSYTRRIPALFETNQLKLEKLSLTQIFPISILEDLKEKKMLVYDFHSKISSSTDRFGLILQEKEIFTKKIIFFYVIENKEIVSLIEKISDMPETRRKIKISKIFKLINDKKIKDSKKNNTLRKSINEGDLKNIENFANKQNQESSSSVLLKELKIVTKTKKWLSVIKSLIVLTVMFIQILSIAICLMIMTIYISSEVNSSNDLTTIKHIGDISFYFSYLAMIVRSLDLNYKYNVSSIYTNKDLADLLPVLNLYKNYTIDDYGL